jgi:hypothetical protein
MGVNRNSAVQWDSPHLDPKSRMVQLERMGLYPDGEDPHLDLLRYRVICYEIPKSRALGRL